MLPALPHRTRAHRRGRTWRRIVDAGIHAAGVFLMATNTLAAQSASTERTAADDVIRPGPHLVVEGVPPLPRSLERETAAYAGFRGQTWLSWHPDRSEMLLLRRAGQSTQVFRLDAPGKAPVQVTALSETVRWAMYPPTRSDYLLLTHDQGGDERHRLFRFDLASASLTPLSDPAHRVGSIAWAAPDRREGATDLVAFTTVATGQRVESKQLSTEVRTLDPLRPDSARIIARLPGIGWSVSSISPDRKTLALTESQSATESYLWVLDIASATKKLLTPTGAEGGASWRLPTFDPRGGRLLALTDHGSEFSRLVAIDLATRASRTIVEHPWSIDGFAITQDGRRLAWRTNEAGRSVLRARDLDADRELPVPTLPPGVIGRFGWRGDHRTLALGLSWARSPATLYAIDTETASLTRWTDERAAANAATFMEPELVRWKSFDGLEISGWLTLPPARFAGRRPVKMLIHGGPEAQSRPGFIGRFNYLVHEEGIAILMPNVRGSSGYGRTFVSLDDGRRREDAVRDAAAALDFVAAHPRLDPGRVLVSGGSYGGYMSLAMATLYPERIACAVNEVGIANFVTFLEQTESYRRDLRRVEYGDERDPEMRRFLESISPLNRADRIRRPLLVVHGANDPRVPLAEAEAITAAVRRSGQMVWSVVARNEGHGFIREENQRFRFLAGVAFARACLGMEKPS